MKNQPRARGAATLPASPVRNILLGLAFLSIIIPFAVIGYMAPGWSFGDALYMDVITVFSVGYGEVQPIDTVWLHTLTMVLIVLGCTGMISLTGAVVQLFTAAQIQQALGQKRMKT